MNYETFTIIMMIMIMIIIIIKMTKLMFIEKKRHKKEIKQLFGFFFPFNFSGEQICDSSSRSQNSDSLGEKTFTASIA